MLHQERSANTPPMRCRRKTAVPPVGRWTSVQSVQCQLRRMLLGRRLRKRTLPGVSLRAQSSRFQNYRCPPRPTSAAATRR